MSADTAVIGPIQGGKGADVVPSPSLDQAREFAGRARLRTRSEDTGRTGGISARGASRWR